MQKTKPFMTKLYRGTFWLALAVTLVLAWLPHPPTLVDNDKAQHALAFLALTISIRLAYSDLDWRIVAITLASLGALIEIVQAIPALHRSCDIYDWYADVATVAVGLMMVAAVRLFVSSFRKVP